ncbi:hypothetical protein D3C87_1885320 [compost metagenome]
MAGEIADHSLDSKIGERLAMLEIAGARNANSGAAAPELSPEFQPFFSSSSHVRRRTIVEILISHGSFSPPTDFSERGLHHPV